MKFLRPILFVQSFVLIVVSLMAVPPMIMAVGIDMHIASAFGWICGLSATAGLVLFLVTRQEKLEISNKQLYLVTVTSWCSLSLFGATPLYFSIPDLSFTNALFESVSGITTTGSTVLVGLDNLAPSLLLWRGLLQWVGGIGIVVLSVAILPYLSVGGMRLFATESSDWSRKSVPRSQQLIRNIGLIYLVLSLLAALTYWLLGMNLFDAIVHAMTSLATGGYANYDASMGHFAGQPAILWAGSLFMLLGALPFLLYIPLLRGNARALLSDTQVRGFLLFVVVLVGLLSIERTISSDVPAFEALTHVAFNVISVITTTGYASEDYTLWGDWAVVVFFYLMFVGGCSGSTAGSVKFFRYQVSFMMLRNQLRRMRHPHAVFAYKYNGRTVTDEVIRSMVAFSIFFAVTIAVIALLLTLTGLDFVTSMSAATTAVTNVGPGLGDIVGPAGNFSSLTDTAKWLLSIGMLLGRLEIMTVIILFTPVFWRG